MRALSIEQLRDIAEARGINYEAPPDIESTEDRTITTRMSREIAIDREAAYVMFANPERHVEFFEIIKASTPLIPLEGALGGNEYIVLEHVQESDLPPRMMIVKYTLNPPDVIRKEAVTDPFGNTELFSDRKRGLVELRFDEVARNITRITCDSAFTTNKGPVFVRGFIDHVWLNFYERLMVETGELPRADMLSGR